MKIVVNRCFGGYSLSTKAVELYYKKKFDRNAYHFTTEYKDNDYKQSFYVPCEVGDSHFMITSFDVQNPNEIDEKILWDNHYLSDRPEERTDPVLVRVIEELGKDANGMCASLQIVEIPDDVDWEIDDYDGMESIHEKHRSW